MTVSGYFLDVELSAQGRPWRPRLDGAGEARALAIAQIGGHGELLARVLAGRGVAPETVERYLDPTLRDLMPDPFVMRDMEAAAARLARAAERGERVAIFGDYDVDGACSAALLSEYLAACGCDPIVHIPDRVTEGYGPNAEAIENFAVRGAKLVVTVDCGAVSHEPFEIAGRLGLDVIVFDSSPGARGAAEGARGRRSEPRGRPLGPRPSRGRGRRFHGAGRAEPGAA